MRQANQEDPYPCHIKDLGFIFKVKDGIKCKPGSDFFWWRLDIELGTLGKIGCWETR